MIDLATIKIKAGNGGDGSVSFRREKFIAKGGPDGGDGGRGGSVRFVVDTNLATLRDFRSRQIYEAKRGARGMAKNMSGAGAEDLIVKVPLGTLVYELRDGREVLIGDLSERGQELLAAQGGIGGKGNSHFKSSTNRTPMQYTEGGKGEIKDIKLEIKMIADVGLIGLPNAGKSTLIKQLTGANVKIAGYAFTTLTPNLAICRLKDGRDIVIADIPGLIEGASEGKGLGHDFLRHIERTRLLIHLVDPLSDGFLEEDTTVALERIFANYKVVRDELKKYSDVLAKKAEIVVINKIDVTEVRDLLPKILAIFKKKKVSNVFGLSAATGEGTEDLRVEMLKQLDKMPEREGFEVQTATKLFTIDNLPNKKMVFKDEVLEKE